mgnify:CR=1 FL=1
MKKQPKRTRAAAWSVLDKAWEDSRPVQLVTTGGSGPGCDGDACAT